MHANIHQHIKLKEIGENHYMSIVPSEFYGDMFDLISYKVENNEALQIKYHLMNRTLTTCDLLFGVETSPEPEEVDGPALVIEEDDLGVKPGLEPVPLLPYVIILLIVAAASFTLGVNY